MVSRLRSGRRGRVNLGDRPPGALNYRTGINYELIRNRSTGVRMCVCRGREGIGGTSGSYGPFGKSRVPKYTGVYTPTT